MLDILLTASNEQFLTKNWPETVRILLRKVSFVELCSAKSSTCALALSSFLHSVKIFEEFINFLGQISPSWSPPWFSDGFRPWRIKPTPSSSKVLHSGQIYAAHFLDQIGQTKAGRIKVLPDRPGRISALKKLNFQPNSKGQPVTFISFHIFRGVALQ